jgi:hypothetical protein
MEIATDARYYPVEETVRSNRATHCGLQGALLSGQGLHEGPPGTGLRRNGSKKSHLFVETTLEKLIQDGINIHVYLGKGSWPGRPQISEDPPSSLSQEDELKINVIMPQFAKPLADGTQPLAKLDFVLTPGGTPRDYDRIGENGVYGHVEYPDMRLHTGFDFETLRKDCWGEYPPQPLSFVYHMHFSEVSQDAPVFRNEEFFPQVVCYTDGGQLYTWPNSFQVSIFNDMIGYVVVSVCIVEIHDKRRMPVLYQMTEITRDEAETPKPGHPEEVINSCLQDHYITLQRVVATPESDAQLEKSNGASWGWSHEELRGFMNQEHIPYPHSQPSQSR